MSDIPSALPPSGSPPAPSSTSQPPAPQAPAPSGQNPTGQNPTGQNPTGQNPTGQPPTGQAASGQPAAGQTAAPAGTTSPAQAQALPPDLARAVAGTTVEGQVRTASADGGVTVRTAQGDVRLELTRAQVAQLLRPGTPVTLEIRNPTAQPPLVQLTVRPAPTPGAAPPAQPVVTTGSAAPAPTVPLTVGRIVQATVVPGPAPAGQPAAPAAAPPAGAQIPATPTQATPTAATPTQATPTQAPATAATPNPAAATGAAPVFPATSAAAATGGSAPTPAPVATGGGPAAASGQSAPSVPGQAVSVGRAAPAPPPTQGPPIQRPPTQGPSGPTASGPTGPATAASGPTPPIPTGSVSGSASGPAAAVSPTPVPASAVPASAVPASAVPASLASTSPAATVSQAATGNQAAAGQASPAAPAAETASPGRAALPNGAVLTVRIAAVAEAAARPEGAARAVTGLVNQPGASAPSRIDGQIAGLTAAGRPVVQSAVGYLALDARADLRLGTRIALDVLASRGAGSAERAAPLPVLAREWPALEAALRVLEEQLGPAGARQALEAMPRPGPQLTATMLFFMAALRGGDVRGWLGRNATQLLEASSRRGLLDSLSDDFKTLQRASEPSETGWRSYLIPVAWDERRPIRLLTRKERRDGRDGRSGKPGTAFLVDLDLSNIGPFRLDGLVRSELVDLLIRTTRPLPVVMRRDIKALFDGTLERTGIIGHLSFKAAPVMPPLPVDLEASSTGGTTTLSV